MSKIPHLIAAATVFIVSHSQAGTFSTELSNVTGASLGTVTFEDSKFGLLIKPQLHGLPAGARGFHIHQFPDCGNNGQNAGGHLDPKGTNSHQGPYGEGHLGDLPVLIVDTLGMATLPTLAPRLTTQMILGHSLMIHAGSDNYSDTPPVGGGGARIACAKI